MSKCQCSHLDFSDNFVTIVPMVKSMGDQFSYPAAMQSLMR